jgi:hypothetical protein
VCIDEYVNSSGARYVKSVIKYSNGTIVKDAMLLDSTTQMLIVEINKLYLSVIGRPGEMNGISAYYSVYESRGSTAR